MNTQRASLESRYWPKVDMSAGLDGCWIWTGSVGKSGYGRINAGGHNGPILHAHHVALDLAGRPLAPRELALHSCDNKVCVNPAHLSAGDHSRNIREAWESGLRDRERQRIYGATVRRKGLERARERLALA